MSCIETSLPHNKPCDPCSTFMSDIPCNLRCNSQCQKREPSGLGYHSQGWSLGLVFSPKEIIYAVIDTKKSVSLVQRELKKYRISCPILEWLLLKTWGKNKKRKRPQFLKI